MDKGHSGRALGKGQVWREIQSQINSIFSWRTHGRHEANRSEDQECRIDLGRFLEEVW